MKVRAHGRGRPALALLCRAVRSRGGGGCTEQRSDKQLQRLPQQRGKRQHLGVATADAATWGAKAAAQCGQQQHRRGVASSDDSSAAFFFVTEATPPGLKPVVMAPSITNELNPTPTKTDDDSHFEPAGMGSLEYYFSFSVMLQFKQAAYHLPIYLL